ncbi:helix-hairpin-helix domain-containing protein [Desulfuromonas sp. KJ2020]|uniref:ComEA family DNA-binding protein n=1 Tax=Desulfuromonas sp. KJ2020 TaxID=2919173 RepID=UPI0020A7E91C|nr:helix-hairpin-helix domain-containing protein [Desulfuromonas sp. KJ2020]
MSLADWTVLPGVGPKLAERIEKDRQKNGDFGSLEALQRVKGIGPKRINSWKFFFE